MYTCVGLPHCAPRRSTNVTKNQLGAVLVSSLWWHIPSVPRTVNLIKWGNCMGTKVFASMLHLNVGQTHERTPAGVREGNRQGLRIGDLVWNPHSLWVHVKEAWAGVLEAVDLGLSTLCPFWLWYPGQLAQPFQHLPPYWCTKAWCGGELGPENQIA